MAEAGHWQAVLVAGDTAQPVFDNAIRAVDYCMEVVGAHGMLKKFPMERYYRDVRAGPNHPLSNARARELLGKVALGIGLSETPRW